MKIPNKRELKQTASSNSSDIDFIDLYKKCIAKSYSFLVIDNTLPSDNFFTFHKESFRNNIKVNHEYMIWY